MAIKYYDDAISQKISSYISDPEIRVLRPEETRELFKMRADINDDKPLAFPMIALSRDNNIELLNPTARPLSYDGKKLKANQSQTAQLNAIPIYLTYQLDIYTRHEEEGTNFVREFVFRLMHDPQLRIIIPYNGLNYYHVANIRLMSTISDTSDIAERLYKDEFSRWTIAFEIQDAFLFSVPYNENWKIISAELDLVEPDNSNVESEPVSIISDDEANAKLNE